MPKPKNSNPETERIEVVVSPENYPRTRAALHSLKRVMAEEAEAYAKRQDLPFAAVPPMILALLQLSERFAQHNIAHMWQLFPDLLGADQFEDVIEPTRPQPQPKPKFRGH